MQGVDTAFAHAAFGERESASSRRRQLLAPDGARTCANDAAIAIA
jgi:hypothetical protein